MKRKAVGRIKGKSDLKSKEHQSEGMIGRLKPAIVGGEGIKLESTLGKKRTKMGEGNGTWGGLRGWGASLKGTG